MELKSFRAYIKKYKYIFIVVLAGIVLMNVPGKESANDTVNTNDGSEFSIDEFESGVEKILAECEGVGRVKVILSVDSGPESVYAKEARKSQREQREGVILESDSDTKPSIMSEGSGKESPIKIKVMYPQFRGALVVCDGADDAAVRRTVIESISALTGLKSDCISVIKMKVSGGQ